MCAGAVYHFGLAGVLYVRQNGRGEALDLLTQILARRSASEGGCQAGEATLLSTAL